MRWERLFSMLLATALAWGMAAGAIAAGQAAPGYLHMRLVKIIDPSGFGRPMEAASLLLPSDWRVESGVRWTVDIGCPANGIRLSLKAQSPDGRLGFEVFPGYSWKWSDDPQARYYAQPGMSPYGIKGCDYLPPYDAAGYLQNIFLPRWRPGSTLVGIGQVQDLAQALQMEFDAVTGGDTGPVRTDFDAALAALETPRNGGTDEEWILASLMRTTAFLPTLSSLSAGYRMAGSYSLASVYQFGARAPKGELERHERLFDAIYHSFRLNPMWEAAVSQHLQTVGRIVLKGIQDRQRIMHQSQQEIAAMIEQGNLGRQAVIERSVERNIQALRGVETYVDPTTHDRVELSSGYRGAWSNGLGDYLLSDVPGFDPGRELGGNWTALKPEGN